MPVGFTKSSTVFICLYVVLLLSLFLFGFFLAPTIAEAEEITKSEVFESNRLVNEKALGEKSISQQKTNQKR